MWHEARKQEKLMRARIVDSSKRAERRRKYYESVRKDPDQFMQLHGRKCTIHADRNIARQAEDTNILRKWQGDSETLIDRFDARSHLDYIPEPKKSDVEPDSLAEKEEIVCDFERYRLLIMNEYRLETEKSYLRKIAEKEFWLSEKPDERDKKKKPTEGKASIGFSYSDSDVVSGSNAGDEGSSGEDDEPQDIDVDLDLSNVDAESQRRANCIGEAYGIHRSNFVLLLRADQKAMREAQELRRIERQKLQLAGREGKHERARLKRERAQIVGRGARSDEATVSLLSFVEKANERKQLLEENSSSSSESEDDVRPQFITSFGGEVRDKEEHEEKSQPIGPALPSEKYRKMLTLSRRDDSPEIKEDMNFESMDNNSRNKRKSRTRSRSRDRDRSRSRNRYRRSSRSRSTRSRSRDRRRRSSSRDRNSRRRRRDRSHSRHRRSRRNSRDRRSSSRDRRRSSSSSTERKRIAPSTSKTSADDNRSRSASDGKSGDESLLEIRSSMSESEKERIEIENRKRRIKKTKRLVRKNRRSTTTKDQDSSDDEKAEIARKLKAKMNKALRQTVNEMREEEREKKKEAEREKRVRDELVFIEEQERRERERQRRKDSSHSKKDRSRSRSPDDRHRRRRSPR